MLCIYIHTHTHLNILFALNNSALHTNTCIYGVYLSSACRNFSYACVLKNLFNIFLIKYLLKESFGLLGHNQLAMQKNNPKLFHF